MLTRLVYLTLALSWSYAEILRTPQSKTYTNGQDTTAYIECEVTPGLLAYWLTNNKILYGNGFPNNPGGDKYVISDDASTSGNFTLVINRLNRLDSGSYTCQTGAFSNEAHILVADPPGTPQISGADGLVENQMANFTCSSEGGYPLPTYTWVKGGVELPRSQSTLIEVDGVQVSKLETRLSFSDHMTVLVCKASNVLKAVETSKQLAVMFKPRVEITPKNMIVSRNASFSLTCKIAANPEWTSILWHKDGVQVLSDQTVYTEARGIMTDTTYTCVVNNTQGQQAASTLVTVHYSPKVSITQGDNYEVDENKELSLFCGVDAKPEASIAWYKGDIKLGTSATLTIPSAQKSDSGEYRCVASNVISPGGTEAQKSSQDSVNVVVRYAPGKPVVLLPSGRDGFNVGEITTLNCQLSEKGKPVASFSWYREGKKQPLATDQVLQFNATSANDTAFYYCEASNSVSKSRSESVLIKFYSKPELIGADGPKVLNGTVGSEARIQCMYRAYPAANITWYKNNKPITPENGYTLVQETTEIAGIEQVVKSSLTFADSQRNGLESSDFGEYSCRASNQAGESVENFSIQVNVIFAPQFTGYGKVASDLGQKVDLVCEVLSYPPASKIVFIRDGAELSVSSIQQNVDGQGHRQVMTHEISSVSSSDYGSYVCTAVNNQGTANATVSLVKTSVPDAPTDLKFTNLTWESVVLSWTPGFDGGFDQTYAIQYGDESETSAQPSKLLTGLKPGTRYEVLVLGRNGKGESAPSLSIMILTPNMSLPTANVKYDASNEQFRVDVNTKGNYAFDYCVTLEGSNNGRDYTAISECQMNVKNFTSDRINTDFSYYRVTVCINHRKDICSYSQQVALEKDDEASDMTVIAVAIVVPIVVIIIIIVIIAAVCIMRRRKLADQKKAMPSSNGHVNPIMTTSSGANIQLSRSSGYNIASDVELDDIDAVNPYAASKGPMHMPSNQPNQNFDYIYASVQKRSAEQNKLNGSPYADVYDRKPDMNIHDPASLSDNSDAFDDHPPSPYRPAGTPTDDDDHVNTPYNRFPSISESGYSTPDSKLQKKVVYEVIV